VEEIIIYYKEKNNILNNCIVLCETYEYNHVAKKIGFDVSPNLFEDKEYYYPAVFLGEKYIGSLLQLSKYLEEWDRVHGTD